MNKDAMIAALIFGGSGSGGGGGADAPFVVAITASGGGGWLSDHSATEIKAAYDADKRVFASIPASAFGISWLTGTLILPFERYTSDEVIFSGSYRGITAANNAATVSVKVANSGLPGYYAANVYASALAPAPLYVNFTITGAAVDNVYPLSADKTLAEIDAAIKAGADIIGTCNIGGQDTPQARIASTKYTNGDLSFVGFTILGTVGGSPVMGVVEYDTNGASLEMIPLSTAQMTYDSGTGTLAITE